MDYLRKHIKQIVTAVLLVAGILLAFSQFLQDNTQRIAKQNEEYLSELTLQRATSIDNLLAQNLTFIESTAYLYGNSLTSAFADVAIIREYEENSAFDMLRFVDASGDNYTSKGVQANLSDRAYFQAGMRGEVGITYVLQSRVTGERQIGFYAPVRFEEKIIGVMVGFYGEEYIGKLLDYDLFGHSGEGWLCTSDGTVLGSTLDSEPDNYLDHLSQGGRCSAAELERIRAAFTAGKDIAFAYRMDGQEASSYAVALEQADWLLVRNFPPSASGQMLRNANGEGTKLIVELLALFALFGVFVGMGVALDIRRERKAGRDSNDISKGVSTLFASFVAIDLAGSRYRYVGGKPGDDDLPMEGPYDQYRASLLARVPEPDLRAEVAGFVDIGHLREALQSSDIVNMRVHAPAPALGIEWLTYSFIVIERDGDAPTRALAVCQDVTELHYKEQEEQERLQRALDAAERASRAKTEFLFNMSHDLRTPMNAIIGYTELAQREDVTPEQLNDFIRKIDSSSVHLLNLINDILEMSRIESGKMTLAPERCDIVAALDEAESMFATQMAGKGVEFAVDASGVEDRWVLCDEARMNRVLLNLLSNAFKFTGEGGRVSVSLAQLGRRDGPDGPVGSYELHVKDTGIGMSPEFAERLFKPFERERTSTVSKTQGTGLGLSITKSIVDLMGGTIEVATEQGAGTEFTVKLDFPILDPAEDAPSAAPAAGDSADFTGKRLLVAEDNPINLEIASMILRQAGFDLDTAENGQVAVEKVEAGGPGRYDAVLMDIQMPVMDGYAATRAIRALPEADVARVPVIAMTANAFAEDVQTAMDAGMNAHIAKPLDVPKMMATLAEVLAAR